jgi:hypothetical protein
MYGQTGSGKTYTMLGAAYNSLKISENLSDQIKQLLKGKAYNNLGIMLYSLMEIFKAIN